MSKRIRSKRVRPLDDKPFKRKDGKTLRMEVLVMRVSLVIIAAAALIAGTALCEAIKAIIIGQSGSYGRVVPEEEYLAFLDQKFSQGIFGRIGYCISAWLSLLVHYFRREWQPVSAYRLGISAVYFIVAVPLMIHWMKKRKQVKLDLASKENRFQLEWADEEILERGSLTAGNLLFIGLTIPLTIGQWFLPLASFEMLPILWLALAFVVWEVAYWVVLRVRFRMGRLDPKTRKKAAINTGKIPGVVKLKKSKPSRCRVSKSSSRRLDY